MYKDVQYSVKSSVLKHAHDPSNGRLVSPTCLYDLKTYKFSVIKFTKEAAYHLRHLSLKLYPEFWKYIQQHLRRRTSLL